MIELSNFKRYGESFTRLWFIGQACPGCGKIWLGTSNELLNSVSRDNIIEAWHEGCLKNGHPELYESETV